MIMRIMEGNQENRTTSGMRQLINLLPEEEIAGLLNTVTSSLVSFGSGVDKNGKKIDARTHAISTILMYTDPISLMNKKRMKKAFLAQYLNQNEVKMTLPPTKNSLSKDILNYWGTDVPDNLKLIDDDESGRGRVAGRTGNPMLPRPDIDASPNSRVPNGSIAAGNQSGAVASTSSNEMVRTDYEDAMDFEYATAVTLRQREAHLGQQLGREFCSWFYERLNTLTDFTSAHFWPECNFRLEIVFAADPGRTILEQTMSGESCCAQLKDLIAVKNLYFNPNTLGSGIRGCLNPHGLAQVVVCGVVHQKENSNPVGVFEQLFGLMKDPSLGNNYRIKFSILRLREGSHLAVQNAPPQLCDSSLVGIIEEIDDD